MNVNLVPIRAIEGAGAGCWSTRSLANRGSGSLAATCNMTGELLATRPGELTMACTRGGALNTILILALPSSLARTQAADTGEVSSAVRSAAAGLHSPERQAEPRREEHGHEGHGAWFRLLLFAGPRAAWTARPRTGPRPSRDKLGESACG